MSPASQASQRELFSGDGEMARRTRDLDGAATPLGPGDRWPRSLLSTVGVMLASRFPMFVWWGPELTSLYNDGCVPLLGDLHPWALGKPASAVWSDAWDTLGPEVQAVLDEGRATWNEERLFILNRNGYPEETYFTSSQTPVRDEDDKVGGVLCALTEDTQSVLGQRRMKALEELSARALEQARSTPEACSVATQVLAGHRRDLSFALVYLLDDGAPLARLVSMTGLPEASAAAPPCIDASNREDRGWPLRTVLEWGRAVVVTDLDRRFGALPGGVWPEPTHTAMVLPITGSGKGRLAGFLVAGVSPRRRLDGSYRVFFDLLASRMGAALSHAHACEARREDERRLRQLVSLMPAAVYTCNAEGRITFYNQRAVELWGREPDPDDRFCGSRRLYRPDGSLLPHAESPMADCVREGTSVRDFTVIAEQPSGARAVVSVNIAPLLDEEGRQAGAINVFEDITERHRAHAEREQLLESERHARAEAQRAARVKDEFLATLSHELRTPLNAITGWAHLIKLGVDDRGRVLRGVEIIDRNARAQAQLIADLLDLSRITTGKMWLQMEPVELPAVVSAAVEAARPAAAARGIDIHCVLEPIDEPVHGDTARLQQILWNLLSNAVKFTPEGGRVQVVLARAGTHVKITVRDTGRGIRPEFLPHVFERFRQADASTTREHGGLGIGLALVKQLTELHGGEVHVTSGGEGLGSTFVVKLPLPGLHPTHDNPRPLPQLALSSPVSAAPSLSGIKVLVVDDEPDAVELMRRILEDCGAEVETAGSVDDALAAVTRAPFDLVLSDIGMPRQDGYELIAELRRRGVKTPAAAVTAFARSEDRTRALRSGYQAHVTKPVDPHELLVTVASLSGRAV